MNLRPYQAELIENIKKSLRKGNNSICAVLGCGGGKSIIMANIAKSATAKENRVLFLVHRKELCEQIKNTFETAGVNMSLCDISMVQTVSRHLDRLPEYKIILCDECHHSTAQSYRNVFERFLDAVKIGFTATPIRLNKGGLGDVYQDLITSVSTQWLIKNKFLAPYKYFSVKLADVSKLRIQAGEYKQDEIQALMENKQIYGDTVKQWEKLAKGKKTIIYCSSVKSAADTAQEFHKHGHQAVALSGETTTKDRQEVVQRFRDGEITVLCNCELFGEGLDIPDCECVVLLRPTQSLTLYVQQSMRSMRYLPNKTAIIIDHVGNCHRFGLPDDDREWSLEPKHKQENTVKIRECKECFAVYPPNLDRCPYCGAEAKHEIRTTDRKTVDIDLQEVKRQELIKHTSIADADLKTWEEVVEFQKIHAYKFAWCLHYAMSHGIEIPKKYNYMKHKFIRR